MKRIENIIKNSEYMAYVKKIEALEVDRKFCRHGLGHLLDVARIGYIINLEENLGYSKDVIYAMGLFHDIGREKEYEKKISHHEAGAHIARKLLAKLDFTENEIEDIAFAISNHKNYSNDKKDLSYILYKADKLSRNCFDCNMYDECYWDENIKNKKIFY